MALGNSHSESKLALPQDMKGSRLPVRDVTATEGMPLRNIIVHNLEKESNSSREMSTGGSENQDTSLTNGKSKNPFKRLFGRSKSHHSHGFPRILAVASPISAKHGLSDRSMSEEDTKQRSPVGQGGGRPRGVSLNKNKQCSTLPSLALHNSNPFACGCRKPTVESPFSVLGTGTDVASPRNPLVASGLSTRNTSHNLGNSINTPTISAQSSRSISYYQAEGSDKSEKLLPLPVRSPNDQLPPPLKQPSVLLTDNFSFPPDGEKRVIGEGGSSRVVTIVSNYRRSNVYALKRFKMFAYEEPDDFYDRCIKEYLIAKKLDGHINIIKIFYIVKVQSSATNGVRRSWAFIMQRCVQDMYYFSTLSGWTNKPLDEKWCCFKQIARGVRHMHTYGIAHRDVKLENVLATDYGALKLTDFGVSTYGIEDPDDKDSRRIPIKGYCGSPPHVPPEVMVLCSDKRKKAPVPDDKSGYDPFAMDMWALGMVLYTLVIPALPFMEAHKDDPRYRQFLNFYEQFCRYNTSFKKPRVYKSGPGAEHPEFSRFQSTDATRVCLRLLDPDPSTRYTMEELFEDPWFQSIETCVDEGTDEPLKIPELRKTTEGSDSPYAHDISPSDEEGVTNATQLHTSNPFLDKLPMSHAVSNCSVLTNSTTLSRPISGSRPLLNIAEDSERSQPLVPSSVELPTLNEEEPTTPRKHAPDDETSSPTLVPTKKISNLSLNEAVSAPHPLAPIHAIEQPSSPVGLSYANNGHSLSRSSSVISKSSVGTPLGGLNSSGSSVASASRSKKKRPPHRHHECNGKPILIIR